jgi:asparagine synthase (glutamine-hydrolysing)
MARRGPDAQGVWESPSSRALFVQTRLSIIGLGSEGDQPSVHPGTTLVINGELYNYRELADADQLAGPLSDTQVVHRLLERDGLVACDRFRGMYAFAYWNESTGAFTIGRDPWGIKPLYVLRHPSGGVTVSSILPSLLLCDDGRRIDPVGIAQYVAFGHTGPDVTCYANITKLAPGTTATYHADGRVTTTTIDQLSSYNAQSVEDALLDSVEAHFIADVEVGVFLSGGVDSTLIAALSRDKHAGLQTFTISFPDDAALDESPLAEHNAKLLGTNHHTVPVTTAQMVAAVDRFLIEHGEPFGDPAALPVTVLSAAAAEHVKVVLTGEGADEVFGGYRRYDVMNRLGFPGHALVGATLGPIANQVHHRRSDTARARAVEAALRGGGGGALAALVDSDLPTVSRSRHGGDVARQLTADWNRLARGATGREAARRFDLARWLPNTYLEKTDRATMAASLEARTPYLDPAVAAAAFVEGRPFGKSELRTLLEQRLPGVQLPARKKGLATPIRLMLSAGLQPSLDWALNDRQSFLNSQFTPRERAALAARADRSSAAAYRLAMMGRWQQQTGLT